MGIGHTTTQKQQLGLRWSHGHGDLIVQPPILISKHLILIDHQQFRPIPLDQPAFLGFERRYDHGRIQIFGKISRSDAHIPPLGPPLC